MADTEVRETKRQVIFVMLVPTGQVLTGFQRPLAASNNPVFSLCLSNLGMVFCFPSLRADPLCTG